jgi:Zn-dependent protease with chaperone function
MPSRFAHMRPNFLLLSLLLLSTSVLAGEGIVMVPEPTEAALSYYYTRNALWFVGGLLGLALPALILFTGWSARIRAVAQRISPSWAGTIFVYLVIYSVIAFLATLPLAWYGQYVVEHEYGFSNQTIGKWVTDAVIGLGVGIATGSVAIFMLYGLLLASPRWWWLYAGLASLPFVFFMILVTPIWIEPLFNRFGPMKDVALEAKILALAQRAGIDGARVFEVEKSADTKKVDAYVTGIGATERIVLSDTIVRKLDERQLLFVMGHEMGHYVLGHGWKLFVFMCTLIMLALYGVQRVSLRLVRRYSARFGFDRLDDVASLPLILVLGGGILTLATPAINSFGRHLEHEADRFALEITRDNYAGASANARMAIDQLGVSRPNSILHLLRDPHPSTADRIEFANSYRPWEEGKALRYEGYFNK